MRDNKPMLPNLLRLKLRVVAFVVTACFFVLPELASAQQDDALIALYSFNNANARDEVSGVTAKSTGISFGPDRFGNAKSACYFSGTPDSYLNLGTGSRLKPQHGSISLWVKMMAEVYSGQGYGCNPIVLTKNGLGDDFFEAYSIGYGLDNKRIGVASSLSHLHQVSAISVNPFKLNEWTHLVMTYDDSLLCLYINGVLESSVQKNFRVQFDVNDSVMVGNSANNKNQRFYAGYIDDIGFYNKALSPEAVAALYQDGDPNRYRNLVLIILGVLSVLALMIFIMVRKFRMALEREKEKNRIQQQVFEMETRVFKAQMNPHFIFNSMNSIQQFILEDDTENANNYLVKFSKLLRRILESSTDDYISLDHEIDILNKYIEIESLRFSSAFTYEVFVDERLDRSMTRIPHMLIQPFVENAIWHGLLRKESNKQLKVSFSYDSADSITCVIDDNGAGRQAAKSPRTLSKRKSLGVHFTAQRLALMRREWGGDYGVEIIDKVSTSGHSDGTRVIVKIPILKN